MTYRVHLYRLLFSMEDDLFRIKKAERVQQLWKVSVVLVLAAIAIYLWMAFLGLGTERISGIAVTLSDTAYETGKLWFVLGRVLYAILFAAFILFFPSLLFYLLTGIPYQKLIIMQQVVLVVMLMERLLWIPLVIFAGLNWQVSPLSLGIIASYITEMPWVIYFFGAITLFQLWIIWFQVKYLAAFLEMKKIVIAINVILLHLIGWCLTALTAFGDIYILSRWFG
ncbi:hypothetical protein [Oceanobacillus polygoni]|uniref:Yip1 domain-containing protein n=1 Tax=Oceanobacillus polygoni TaxID=1235259 RepID=A0A9X1CDI1_9BACI|nr:hypothetical protein [Oceanobacillus polygoni]MBP2079076.1 hypothetical protein [Oceanobacillus polygoni]